MSIKLIIEALASIPKIVDLLGKMSEQIGNYVEQRAIEKRIKEFKEAMDHAKETKDTSGLERLFRGIK